MIFKNKNNLYILLVLMIVVLRPMGLMLYLPSLPSIKTFFLSSNSTIQLSVFIYCLGLGLSQLFYGPISDVLGRKKVVVFGIVLLLISSFVSAFTTSILVFLLLRAFQGIGAGCDFCITTSIMKDIYPGEINLSKVIALSEITYGASIMLTPLLGGYLQELGGWKYSFYFISAYCLILIVLAYLLKNLR